MSETVTKRQLERRIEQVGNISLRDTGCTLSLVCRRGWIFSRSSLHFSATYPYGNGAWTKSEVYAFLIDDLSMGVEKCDCEECTGMEY